MNSLLITIIILFYLCVFCTGMQRNWNYEFLFASATSSDESLLNASIRLENEALGVQTISAVMDWKFDVDKNTTTEMNIYNSYSGREEYYHLTPHKIPNISFYEFLEQYYMKLIYTNFGTCSNLPVLEEPFVPKWPKNTYVFNKCKPPGDGYPEMVPVGYYKLVFKVIGKAELKVTLTMKITPKFI